MAQKHAGPEAAVSGSLTKVAVGLAAAALVGWRAGGTTPQNVLAFGALIVGAVLFVIFLVFALAEA